jgi:hypothetical protein
VDDWVDVPATKLLDHATLIGHASNSFHGDLEIYRVNP